MLNQDFYKSNLILAPATIQDCNIFKHSYYAIYALYKNDETNEIEIGIPGMINHTDLHNMDGFDCASEKAYFINLGYAGIEFSDTITDRPIYVITPNENRTVKNYSIINEFDTSLEDILKPEQKRKTI